MGPNMFGPLPPLSKDPHVRKNFSDPVAAITVFYRALKKVVSAPPPKSVQKRKRKPAQEALGLCVEAHLVPQRAVNDFGVHAETPAEFQHRLIISKGVFHGLTETAVR